MVVPTGNPLSSLLTTSERDFLSSDEIENRRYFPIPQDFTGNRAERRQKAALARREFRA